MRRNYSVSPAMIGAQAGVLWSYDNPSIVWQFDDSHPLDVSTNYCNDSTFCLWYVSPLWAFADPKETQYALLGESNKWTAVSQQRFDSLTNNNEGTQTTIRLQGASHEVVQVSVYHSKLGSTAVKCLLSTDNDAK
jgi:hypothetical protein